MREVFVDRLQAMGIPAWLVPDYWFMLTLAIIVASVLSLRLAKRLGFPERVAADLLFWGILSLFVGSKFLYFLQFGFPPSVKGWVNGPGMSLYGGLLGLLIAWGLYYLIKPYPLLLFLDTVTPPLAIGLVLGRMGCFLAGCNGGTVCGLPWAVRFPASTSTFFHHVQAGLAERGDPFSLPAHPTQLYESFFGLLAFGLLLILLRKPGPPGQIFFTGMLWYAVYRFATEWLRIDSGGVHPFGVLTFAQFVSLILCAAAGLGLLRLGRRSGQRAQSLS